MASTRSGRQTVQLGDSWVVEGDEPDSASDDSRPEDKDETRSPSAHSHVRRKLLNPGPHSSAPELVMPLMDVDVMMASPPMLGRGSQRVTRSQASRPDVDDGPRRRNVRSTTTKQSKTAQQSPIERVDFARQRAALFEFFHSTASALDTIIRYLGGLFGESLWILRSVLAYLLAGLILFGLIWFLRTLAIKILYDAISPVCVVPGASLLLPFCANAKSSLKPSGPGSPAQFEQLMEVQSKFEEVLVDSAGGHSLPLDMKRSEASIRDLRQLVRYSTLPSKNELVYEFDGFIETARMASHDLLLFNSHITRGVDLVLASTGWTTMRLKSIVLQIDGGGAARSFSLSKLSSFFMAKGLDEKRVLDEYIRHTAVVEAEIHRLIDEAQALLMILNNLDDRLEIIHSVVTRDDVHVQDSKEEILAQLWTMVGGNRGKLKKMDRHLSLLGQVGVYRKSAYAHVSGTILRLQEMGVALEDLRERVAAPGVLRDQANIPLNIHLESVQRGVERLERSRDSAKALESENMRERLERDLRCIES